MPEPDASWTSSPPATWSAPGWLFSPSTLWGGQHLLWDLEGLRTVWGTKVPETQGSPPVPSPLPGHLAQADRFLRAPAIPEALGADARVAIDRVHALRPVAAPVGRAVIIVYLAELPAVARGTFAPGTQQSDLFTARQRPGASPPPGLSQTPRSLAPRTVLLAVHSLRALQVHPVCLLHVGVISGPRCGAEAGIQILTGTHHFKLAFVQSGSVRALC